MLILLIFIRILGCIMMLTGGALVFGAYKLVQHSLTHFSTMAQFFIPSIQLIAGWGLLRLRDYGRQLTVCLAVFYSLLGTLVLLGVFEVTHYLPVVPLIEYIPTNFLNLNLYTIAGGLLFGTPFVLLALFPFKPIATRFNSELKEQFVWSAPFPVMVASAFIFSFGLLSLSQAEFFIHPGARTIFGLELNQEYGQMSRYAEFLIVLILSMWIMIGRWLSWVITLAVSAYFCWAPLALDRFSATYLTDIKFVVFGIGWFFVVLTLGIYQSFFFFPEKWNENRQNRNQAILQAVVFWILFLIFAGLAVYPSIAKQNKSSVPEVEEVEPTKPETPTSPSKRPSSGLKMDGTSIDGHGAYAIVNNLLVKVGDKVDDYTVKKVEMHRVILSKDGVNYELDEQSKLTRLSKSQ